LSIQCKMRLRQSTTGRKICLLSFMLRPTLSRSVCIGIKHPSRANDQIFIAFRQLRVCRCGELSLTRGRVCRLQLLLALVSAVILGSESHLTRDHILPSLIRDFPFRRLLRLAGLQWRYSTPASLCPLCTDGVENTVFNGNCFRVVFTALLPSNGSIRRTIYVYVTSKIRICFS
jgi:hypothetical protein